MTVNQRLEKLLAGKLAPYLRMLFITDPELYRYIMEKLKT